MSYVDTKQIKQFSQNFAHLSFQGPPDNTYLAGFGGGGFRIEATYVQGGYNNFIPYTYGLLRYIGEQPFWADVNCSISASSYQGELELLFFFSKGNVNNSIIQIQGGSELSRKDSQIQLKKCLYANKTKNYLKNKIYNIFSSLGAYKIPNAVATVTTSQPHGYSYGEGVLIEAPIFNGVYIVVGVPTPTTFNINSPWTNLIYGGRHSRMLYNTFMSNTFTIPFTYYNTNFLGKAYLHTDDYILPCVQDVEISTSFYSKYINYTISE